jgi:hypothetical protein
MGGTTPISNLPYPLGTDRVMDGDDAIKALATALDPFGISARGAVSFPLWNYSGTGFQAMGSGVADAGFPCVNCAVTATGVRVNIAGVYAVTAAVSYNAGTVGTVGRRSASVGVNGGVSVLQNTIAWASNAGGGMVAAGVLFLAANDVVGTQRYTDIANHFSSTTGWVSVARIGP